MQQQIRLTKVTVTGADDNTDIDELLELSTEYPFVEWGILVGAGSHGRPRWPSIDWQNRFVESCAIHSARKRPEILTAMHVCGALVKELLQGNWKIDHLAPVAEIAQRVQINTHGEIVKATDAFYKTLDQHPNCFGKREWIFQLDGVNDHLLWAAESLQRLSKGWERIPLPTDLLGDCTVTGLFDMSHGAGVYPSKWPTVRDSYRGFAGGIGPDNIVQTLESLTHDGVLRDKYTGPSFWIDMETRVRTEDDSLLDMNKVRRVLELCTEWKERA